MSKILNASCDATGKVTCEGFEISTAQVLSEGKQDSTGLLFLEGESASYLPSSATDIKATLEKTSAALEKIAEILQSIGAGMTGASTAPPPTLATDLTALNNIRVEIDQLSEALK